MLEYDFENSVGFWVCQASHAIQRDFNEELAPQGVTYRQAQVLGCLALEGRLSQTDLAERMRIEPPTLVGILDRMEQGGWIRRDADKSDRRRKFIQPTLAAKPVWSKIVAAAKRVRTRAARGLSAAQLAQLKKLLGLVQANLKQAAAQREAG
ncbi:MAG TPA: MarR family transcriptional regulator [Pirellulaceae bacterium]|nr:MarR family transcriptional regulator [Pirellulaceae bacterium]